MLLQMVGFPYLLRLNNIPLCGMCVCVCVHARVTFKKIYLFGCVGSQFWYVGSLVATRELLLAT